MSSSVCSPYGEHRSWQTPGAGRGFKSPSGSSGSGGTSPAAYGWSWYYTVPGLSLYCAASSCSYGGGDSSEIPSEIQPFFTFSKTLDSTDKSIPMCENLGCTRCDTSNYVSPYGPTNTHRCPEHGKGLIPA